MVVTERACQHPWNLHVISTLVTKGSGPRDQNCADSSSVEGSAMVYDPGKAVGRPSKSATLPGDHSESSGPEPCWPLRSISGEIQKLTYLSDQATE